MNFKMHFEPKSQKTKPEGSMCNAQTKDEWK